MLRLVPTAAVAAGLVLLAACSSEGSPPAPAAPAPPTMVTVTVGAGGVEQMSYTDPAGPNGVTTVAVGGPKTKTAKISVPTGTTVRITNSGIGMGASCWISNATDQLVFTRGTDRCEAVAS